jgi:hypothetical protein
LANANLFFFLTGRAAEDTDPDGTHLTP